VLFLFTLVLFTGFSTLLLVYPVEPLAKLFELIPISKKNEHVVFRLSLLAFPGVHLLAALFIEVRQNTLSLIYIGTKPIGK
jgi:hypothetical protein